MKDSEIVELYQNRNESAIAETAKKYESYLSKIAYNILADFEDSKECVNEAYLAAWNSIPPQNPNVLSTYLGKIVRQIAIDRYRKKHTQKRFASEYALSLTELEDCFPGGRTPEKELDEKMLSEAINAFSRALPPQDRAIFIGRYFFFDSFRAISGYSGLSEANVRTKLHRIRLKLKEYLSKEGFEL